MDNEIPQDNQREGPDNAAVTRPLDLPTLIANQMPPISHQSTAEIPLNSPSSHIRTLIGKGQMMLSPISSLPLRYTVKTFSNGRDIYFYSNLKPSSFRDPKTFIEHIFRVVDEDIAASQQFLTDDGHLSLETQFINPDKVGFPFSDCLSQYMKYNEFKSQLLRMFEPIVERPPSDRSMIGRAITVNTYDDPTVARCRAELRSVSASMPARAQELMKRQQAIWDSDQEIETHNVPLSGHTMLLPMMSHTSVRNHLTAVGAPSTCVIEDIYEMARLSVRPNPLSIQDSAVQTMAGVNKASPTNIVISLSQPATYADDLSWFLKSLLTPGSVLLDIDFRDAGEAENQQLVFALYIRLICMFSPDDMYSNITLETSQTIDRIIRSHLKPNPQRMVHPATSSLENYPYMNKFTRGSAEDPLCSIYPTVARRKDYFIDASHVGTKQRVDVAKDAVIESPALQRVRQFLHEVNTEKAVKELLSLLMSRLAEFFLDWNLAMKTAWYVSCRPGQSTMAQSYDQYSKYAHIHRVNSRSMLYMVKSLAGQTLICRSSTTDNLKIEIGLAYEVNLATYRSELLSTLEGRFSLTDVLSNSERYSLIFKDLPYLTSLHQALKIQGNADNIRRILNQQMLDNLFRPYFREMFNFTEERYLRNGIITTVIANEGTFRIDKSQIDALIRAGAPYRNVNTQEPAIDSNARYSFTSLFSLASKRSFNYTIANIDFPIYIDGFFPFSTASMPPSNDGTFPLAYPHAELVVQDFASCIHIAPVVAYTTHFEKEKFIFLDHYVLPSGNSSRISIPNVVHLQVIRTIENFLESSNDMKIRQVIYASDDFKYINFFDTLLG